MLIHTHLSIFSYELLVIVGFIASIVDTIAGNGGLLVVPVLLSFGILPLYALGTNKLQESVGQIVATIRFLKTGEITWKPIIIISVFCVIGTSLGAMLVQIVHQNLLQKIIPALLMFALLCIIFSGRLFSEQDTQRLSFLFFSFVFGLCIGFYNGFFGPGTGTLWTAAFLYFLSMNVKQATMYAKPANLSCNLIALIWFVINHHVAYYAAFALMIGQVIGANVGAKLVIHKAEQLVKPIYTLIVMLLTADLFYKFLINL